MSESEELGALGEVWGNEWGFAVRLTESGACCSVHLEAKSPIRGRGPLRGGDTGRITGYPETACPGDCAHMPPAIASDIDGYRSATPIPGDESRKFPQRRSRALTSTEQKLN
jgi:hypothetical protein